MLLNGISLKWRITFLGVLFIIFLGPCSAQSTNETFADVQTVNNIVQSVDTAWVVLTSVLIFMMQTGFTMLEAGTVTKLHTKNILFKNLLDICVGAVCFYCVGFGVGYGVDHSDPNPFWGTKYFFLKGVPDENVRMETWLFSFSFCATCATIVSGAIAERVRVIGYLTYVFVVNVIVFPVIAHWEWSETGWLSAYNKQHSPFANLGMLDFAGCAAVHMVGGFSSLVAAYLIGYRGQYVRDKDKYPARFEQDTNGRWHVNDFTPNNEGQAVLGTLLLWFGWYGFNCGSTGALMGKSEIIGRVAVNTTLAPATAAVVSIFIGPLLDKSSKFNLLDGINGILSGLVSITGPCAVVTPYAAVVIGAVGAICFKVASIWMLKMRIDDPVDAFAVHGMCGMWGLLAAGFFATEEFTKQTYQRDSKHDDWGIFYGGNGSQFGVQLLGILVVALWSSFFAFVVFAAFKLLDYKIGRPFFIFKDEKTFEVLVFGASAPEASPFVQPSFQMVDLPTLHGTHETHETEDTDDSSKRNTNNTTSASPPANTPLTFHQVANNGSFTVPVFNGSASSNEITNPHLSPVFRAPPIVPPAGQHDDSSSSYSSSDDANDSV